VARAPVGTWRLTLAVVEGPPNEARTREHTGRTCTEVVDAAVVSIAMVVRAELGSSGDATPEESQRALSLTDPPRPAPLPRDQQARPAPRTPPGASSRTWLVSAAVGGVGDVGALPEPSLGIGLEAGFGWRRLRLLGTLAAFPPAETSDSSERGGEFGLLLAGALACVEQTVQGWSALACGGYEIGSLSGEGVGVTDPRPASVRWQALRAEAGARLPLGQKLGVLFRLGAAFPLERPTFVLNETDVVHRPSGVGARALIALGASF
jgi:hypothetical protein